MALTSATVNLRLFGSESLSLSEDHVSDPTVAHSDFGTGATSVALSSGSTPPATQIWSDQITLSAGAATVDLSALTHPIATLDLTGLKVQAIKIAAASANTAAITASDGATNGYNIFGDASGQVTIAAGGEVVFYNPEGNPDVGAAAKTIDFSSGDTDAIFDIMVIAG